MSEGKSVFEVLNAINCNGHTEKKKTGGVELTYLSWAWAWQMVKENYPTAFYTIYESETGMLYHTDGHTCWVKTGVTIEGLEHIEYLPVMDYSNRSITLDKLTSVDVNKAVQRSLTKACARHGLGLYIYAGEDLPSAKGDAPADDDELDMALQDINGARSLTTLVDIFNSHQELHTNPRFMEALGNAKKKFNK